MLSKKFVFSIALVCGVALMFSSCGWTGENRFSLGTVSFRGVKKRCFDDFPLKVKKYLRSSLGEDEIHQFFSCLEHSIDDFFQRTEPQDKEQGYTFAEVQSLFKTFMIDKASKNQGKSFDSKTSAKHLLSLKRMFVGGLSSRISKKDWDKMKLTFPRVKKFLIDTKPYIEFYYFYRPSSLDRKTLAFGHKMFSENLYSLIEFLKSSGSLLNSEEIGFLKDQILDLGNILRTKPVIDGVVDIFYEFQSSQHEDNWTNLIKIAERGLRVMAYTKLAEEEPYPLFSPEGFLNLSSFMRSIIDAIDLSYKVNQKNNLDQNQIENLIVSLYDSKILFTQVENRSVLRSLVSESGRYFFTTAYRNPNSWYIAGDDIKKYKFFYNRFMSSLSHVFYDESTRDLHLRYKEFLYDDKKIGSELVGMSEGKEVWDTVASKVVLNLPFPKEGLRVNFEKHQYKTREEQVIADFYGTVLTNIVLFVYETYGRQSNVNKISDKKIYEHTLKRLYHATRPFFISQGLADPTGCNAGSRTFMEANLFGYSSNGDDEVDIQEGIEWLASVYSVNLVVENIFEGAKASGCSFGNRAVLLGQPFLKEQCFRKYLSQSFKTHFKHLGKLLDFIDKSQSFDDLYDSLFNVVRTCPDIKLPLSYSEVIYYTSLIQYIEALFEKYDQDRQQWYFFTKDRDTLLDRDELMLVYDERFKNTLKRIAKLEVGGEVSDFNLKHLYKKLLIYKKLVLPKDSGGDLMWFLSDLRIPFLSLPLKPLDRIDVYTIFNSIATRNERSPFIQDYCKSLSLAWEEYQSQQEGMQNQSVFEFKVPYRTCSKNTP